jgi:hypothetical protein
MYGLCLIYSSESKFLPMNKVLIHGATIDDSISWPLRPADDDSNHRLRVAVVFTTPEGTVAALRAAADFAKHLDMRITLFVAEAVPFHFSLDRPHVPIDFLERRSWVLVRKAGIVDEEVNVEIRLCRNRMQTLRSILAGNSLVVIGGRKRWWRRTEQKLGDSLQRLGHHTILVEADRSCRKIHPGRQAAFLQTLEIEM